MKNKSISIGRLAAISPLPAIIFTALWSWMWTFGIGIGLLNYDSIPEWILFVSLFPLIISPMISFLGLVQGIVSIKQRRSFSTIVLSIMGLIENFVLIYGIYYLDSNY